MQLAAAQAYNILSLGDEHSAAVDGTPYRSHKAETKLNIHGFFSNASATDEYLPTGSGSFSKLIV